MKKACEEDIICYNNMLYLKMRINMNFNLYINDDLVHKMQEIMKNTGKKRNTIIIEAIKEYVAKRSGNWSKQILEFKGIEGIENWDGFESDRNNMNEPKENIFEE